MWQCGRSTAKKEEEWVGSSFLEGFGFGQGLVLVLAGILEKGTKKIMSQRKRLVSTSDGLFQNYD